jgi:hypothetical protein
MLAIVVDSVAIMERYFDQRFFVHYDVRCIISETLFDDPVVLHVVYCACGDREAVAGEGLAAQGYMR